MRSQRQVVDYALQRRALLADVHAGRTGVAGVCDASPYLLRAAQFHGEPTEQSCPLCRREQLTHVSWIFGDELRHASGSARRPEELARLSELHGEFTVYLVEVCRGCHWNHLVLCYVLGGDRRSGADPSGEHRRTGTDRSRTRAAE